MEKLIPQMKKVTPNGLSSPSSSWGSLEVMDWLRFPMAICVIFIHSFGSRPVDCLRVAQQPFSWFAAYEVARTFFSRVFPGFAVPLFFLFSGYLFFRNFQQWEWPKYRAKVLRRLRTLVLPYLGWNIFHCIHLCWPLFVKCSAGTAPWTRLWSLMQRLGGWRMLWDAHVNQPVYLNILGVPMPFTAPVLAPLWFLRDLMIVVLLSPLIYWLLRRGGRWVLSLFTICFLFNVWIPLHGLSATTTLWFSLGAYYALQNHELVPAMRRWRLLAYPVALLSMILLLWQRVTIPGPDTVWLRVLNSLYVLSSSFSVVSLAGAMASKGWLRLRPWVVQSTFFIYLSHIFLRKQVLKAVVPLVPKGHYPSMLLSYLLVPLLTALVCIAVRQLALFFIRSMRPERGAVLR